MYSALLNLILAALSPASVDPAGCWALRAEGVDLMRLRVTRSGSGWTGTWQHPRHYTLDSASIGGATGPVVEQHADEVRDVAGGVELVFEDLSPGAIPDRLFLRPQGAIGQLSYNPISVEPWSVQRIDCAAAWVGWNADRTYTLPIERSTSAEMTAIFEADQTARASGKPIDWNKVGPEDRDRRIRTQALLDGGKLQSGDDYLHAAFVFQHGDNPADFLKAHALAVIALARGKLDAAWIAAATLDRYLQSIGRPQIYGTQFQKGKSGWTQAPYDKTLISDAVRAASRVPPLPEQAEQLRAYQGAPSATAKPTP